MIRVLIVDDHQVVRQGPELYVVGEAVDGTETIEKPRQLYPDVVFMDLALPKLDGLSDCDHPPGNVRDTRAGDVWQARRAESRSGHSHHHAFEPGVI